MSVDRPKPTRWYKIVSRESNKVLHIEGDSHAEGAEIIQRDYNGGHNQQWRFQAKGDDSFQITSRSSLKALNIKDGSVNCGAKLIQWPSLSIIQYNNFYTCESPSDRFVLQKIGKDYFIIHVVHSGKVLQVHNASHENCAPIVQWDYKGDHNQQWRLEEIKL